MKRKLEILLAEDNPGDVFLVSRALEGAASPYQLHTVASGKDAVDFLQRSGRYAEAVRPDLMILDLNLPLMSGREVLRQIKTDAALSAIPVVVFSSSSDPEDVRQSYELRANAYVVKAAGADRFRDAVLGIVQFWSSVATLPVRRG